MFDEHFFIFIENKEEKRVLKSGARPNGDTSAILYITLQHAYIYIYICSSLGVFGSYYLVQVGFLEVIIWSKFVFLAYKNSGFKRFGLHTQLSFCVFFFVPNFLAIF